MTITIAPNLRGTVTGMMSCMNLPTTFAIRKSHWAIGTMMDKDTVFLREKISNGYEPSWTSH